LKVPTSYKKHQPRALAQAQDSGGAVAIQRGLGMTLTSYKLILNLSLMSTKATEHAACGLLLVILALVAPLQAVELIDQTGRKIQADLVKLQGGELTVALADRTQRTFPLSRLTAASQQLVTRHFGSNATPAPPSTAPWEKWFSDGLVDANGKDVALATLNQKLVVVYFSSSTCGICNHITAALKRLRKAAGERVEIVSVCFEDSAEDLSRYMKAKDMTWPAVRWTDHGNKEGKSNIRTLAGKYSGWGTPTVVFLNADGSTADADGRPEVQGLAEDTLDQLQSINFKEVLRRYRDYRKERNRPIESGAEQKYMDDYKQRIAGQIAEFEKYVLASKTPPALNEHSSWSDVLAVFHHALRK
jgi:thiol-disulfide isomerase/thioredoxin